MHACEASRPAAYPPEDRPLHFNRIAQHHDAFGSYALGLVRIAVALAFLQHGTHKLFNLPSGPGFIGFDVSSLEGWAGVIELVAGTLVLIGLFTRFAALIASGEMAVAYWMIHARSPTASCPRSLFMASA